MTLFDEIAGHVQRPNTARDAIVEDLARMCAVRRGSLLLAPEYGVDEASLLLFAFPAIDGWAARLVRSLARYEPRLRAVRVVPLEGEALDLTLRAEIHAVLVGPAGATETRFSGRLDSQCRLNVA